MAFLQHAGPFIVQILAHQSPVTMMWLILRAEQKSALQGGGIKPLFDRPLRHQAHKPLFVDTPISPVPLIGFQNIIGRRQKRLMKVVHTANFLEEICKIVRFGEPGQLRCIVEADIHHFLHVSPLDALEKSGGTGLGEPYRRDDDVSHARCSIAATSPASDLFSTYATFAARARYAMAT